MSLSREAVNCQYGGHGGSLLHAAVAEGDRKAASLLIAAGARFLFKRKLDWKRFLGWFLCMSDRFVQFVHPEWTCLILTDELLFILLLAWETRFWSFFCFTNLWCDVQQVMEWQMTNRKCSTSCLSKALLWQAAIHRVTNQFIWQQG